MTVSHPNSKQIYALSYPRSGKSWFLYCFEQITGTKTNPPQLLYHAHYNFPHEGHPDLNLKGNFDLKNILLLRNPKEAIWSHFLNHATRGELAFSNIMHEVAHAMTYEGCSHPGNVRPAESPLYDLVASHRLPTRFEIDKTFCNITPQHDFEDFWLDKYPRFGEATPADDDWWVDVDSLFKPRSNLDGFGDSELRPVELPAASPVFHAFISLQLQRYYELLEYHHNIFALNPANALLIRYEDLVENPHMILKGVVEFMEKTSMIPTSAAEILQTRVERFMDDIDHHRDISMGLYRGSAHKALTGGNTRLRYSDTLREERDGTFLLCEMDRVLKKKNPVLFEKYLTEYEEGEENANKT